MNPSPGGARELFVYYKVASSDEARAASAVQAAQAKLVARHPKLCARLLRRSPGASASESLHTWMETYSIPATGIDEALQAEIERALAPAMALIGCTRHTETFIPCAW